MDNMRLVYRLSPEIQAVPKDLETTEGGDQSLRAGYIQITEARTIILELCHWKIPGSMNSKPYRPITSANCGTPGWL
jgi:hypothetical protein